MYPIIYLGQGLEIPSFFLVISLVLSTSLFWVWRRASLYNVPTPQVLDLSLLLMLSSLIGARAFHILYENPEYYSEFPLRVFYLWEGGFVYFGGMITATLTAFAYFKFQKIRHVGDFFDTFAPVLAFSYGAGRIGCFLAGCCYGKFCNAPWAIDGRHPTQLYATFWEFGVLLLLLGLEKRSFLKRPGNLFLLWIVFHAVGRILMESYRDDFRGAQVLGLSISTLICAILGIAAAAALVKRRSS